MNEEELIKQLEQVDLSDINLPGHQRQLGKALLDSGRFKPSTPMSMIRKAYPIGGAIAAAAVIAVVVLSFKSAPRSSAQQVAQRSYQAVVGLPPASQAALKAHLGLTGPAGIDDLLRQAQTARDLRVLTADELGSQFPGVSVSSPPLSGQVDNTTFLVFTGQDGVKYAVGVDNGSRLPTVALAGAGIGKTLMALPGSPQGQSEKATVLFSRDKQGAVMNVNGREIRLPAGIDPQTAKVEFRDGNIYVNGQMVQQH